MMKIYTLPQTILNCREKTLDLSQPHVMGILNVTPDSFSDGGLYQQHQHAIRHAEQMIQDGASIIDIGGESTRPNAPVVSLEQELERVIPIVELLKNHPVVLSIDTSQPEVIRQAVQAGAHIWNDVRALTRPQALQTAQQLDIPVILMHNRGEPDTMNQLAHYDDVVTDVQTELMMRVQAALQAGIRAEHIILDVGFGFAKDTQHNVDILKNFYKFQSLGFPLLSGLSRKRFIGAITQQTEAQSRVQGSVTAHLLSIMQGASIVRVHDVKATVEAIKVWQAMLD